MYEYVKSYKNTSYGRCINKKNNRFKICDYGNYGRRGKFGCLQGIANIKMFITIYGLCVICETNRQDLINEELDVTYLSVCNSV